MVLDPTMQRAVSVGKRKGGGIVMISGRQIKPFSLAVTRAAVGAAGRFGGLVEKVTVVDGVWVFIQKYKNFAGLGISGLGSGVVWPLG